MMADVPLEETTSVLVEANRPLLLVSPLMLVSEPMVLRLLVRCPLPLLSVGGKEGEGHLK